MALSKPILFSVAAFDSTIAQTFYFTVVGGTQPVSNKLVIRNNDTGAIIYEQTQTTFKYEHVLPANTLTNGTYYNAVVSTFDSTGAESPASNQIQFWCYSQPTLTFTNIPPQGLIENSSYNFEFTYNQAEKELLNSYTVNLYNSSRVLISTSGQMYLGGAIQPPNNLNYLITGFDDNSTYFIEVNGVTVENTVITTGQISITVKYVNPEVFAIVELTNNCEEGYITIKSNISLINGESNPSPPIYIQDKEVDLTADGSWVAWNQGYTIGNQWTAKIWFRKPNDYSEILRFSSAQGKYVSIRFNKGYKDVTSPDLQAYFTLQATSLAEANYEIFSDYIPILPDTEYYCLWIRCINNLYQFILA